MKNPYFFMLQTSFKYGKGVRFFFILNIFICVISFSIRLLEPYIFGKSVNLIQENSPNLLNNLIFNFILFFLIIVIFRLFFTFSDYLRTWTGYHITKNFKEFMYDKLLKISFNWHNDNHSGKTINQINTAFSSINSFNTEQHQTISMIINFFGPIIALFLINTTLGFLSTIGGLLIFFNSIFFDKYIRKYYKKVVEKNSKINAVLFDYISNIGTIITLRIGGLTKIELLKKIQESYHPIIKRNRISFSKWTLYDIESQGLVAICLMYYCYDILTSGSILMIGSLTMIYTYLQNMKSSFYNFNLIYNQLMLRQTEVESTDYILNEKDFYTDESNFKKKNWKEIEIKNLSFSYNYNQKSLNLNNINLKIKNKSKIAFIGESGSGKSTLLKVLRGLYLPNNIEVLIDSKKYDFKYLGNYTTLIPQEPELFENTIKYNVSLGVETKNEKILEAIELAQFEKTLQKLSNGLDTNINEKGVNLSGGEKQRLALARGLFFVNKSDLILLDEPTSSVDSLNEIKIYENVTKKFKDKTIISVIHRLNLLKYFDYIYLFDNGKVVGEGTFDELLLNEKFKKIWEKNNLKN